MNLIKSHKSQHSSFWNALILFMLVSGLLVAADQLSIRFGLHGAQRIADDLLGGVVAASIFHSYERQRLRRFRRHLHVIDLMNHHIRNALQPLMFVPEGNAQMKVVEDCVRRIDWALREVLPGDFEESSALHLHAAEGWSTGDGTSSPWQINEPRHESAHWRSRPFFGQWLDTWRTRNQKASE